MKRLATLAVAAGALALTLVTLAPDSASAGWRRWGWGGPGVGVYVGPGWGYGYGYYPYRYLRLLPLRLLSLLARPPCLAPVRLVLAPACTSAEERSTKGHSREPGVALGFSPETGSAW